MEETIKLKNGYKLEIVRDEDAENPNQWGNTDAFLVYDHRQFFTSVGNINAKGVYEDKESYEENYHIFPVDAYIHSGTHLSLANTANYPDRRWDVSTTGFCLIRKKEWPEESEARKMAESVIDEWNTYLSGDVYGFQLIKERKYVKKYLDSGMESEEFTEYEEIDACYGFYGDDWKTNGIMEYIPEELIPDELKEAV